MKWKKIMIPKYFIRYLDEVIKPLVLIVSKISGYFKIFEEKTDELISLHIDDDHLFEKYKPIWTLIEDLSLNKFYLEVYPHNCAY